ncbi:MAG TPA: hypothetical protein VIM11_13875 [Tepidisphaeraceae bacterium]
MSINFSALTSAAIYSRPLTLDHGTPREGLNDLFNPGAAVSLNPQPLPPKVAYLSRLSPGSTVSLSPQPLPPKELLQSTYLNPGVLVELNPQPLPPDPPPELANLWTHSAVLTSSPASALEWFHPSNLNLGALFGGIAAR